MSNLLSLTSAQLIQAANIKDKIATLEKQLAAILGSPAKLAPSSTKPKFSAAARAKISAAQKARWAKTKSTPPVAKKKSKMSAAGRARIAAAAKARWAKVKAAGKNKL